MCMRLSDITRTLYPWLIISLLCWIRMYVVESGSSGLEWFNECYLSAPLKEGNYMTEQQWYQRVKHKIFIYRHHWLWQIGHENALYRVLFLKTFKTLWNFLEFFLTQEHLKRSLDSSCKGTVALALKTCRSSKIDLIDLIDRNL